MIERASKADE